MRAQVREADMRSLDRRRLYEIFAPLDADERLPRELLMESRRFRSLGRREAAGILWLPSLLLSLSAVKWMGGSAPAAVAAAGGVLVALGLFAKSGKR
ncbi:MAG: hypothetical protein QOG08_867 [Chloroflexota bacterium]|jgi:hypothetical protein|nr:hypothetical protein [Chloroflexota bacterium]